MIVVEIVVLAAEVIVVLLVGGGVGIVKVDVVNILVVLVAPIATK